MAAIIAGGWQNVGCFYIHNHFDGFNNANINRYYIIPMDLLYLIKIYLSFCFLVYNTDI